jgi:AcrR family transcriptional regulator
VPRSPRKDQLRNRDRLLDAARTAFGEDGPQASIETIARRAGVGATTFYRHFPTKDDLVDELLDRLAEDSRSIAVKAETISDDWEAFCMVFVEGCALDDTDLRLFDTLCRTSTRASERGRRATAALIEPVVLRAKRSGRLAPDVTVDQVAAFMRMIDSSPTQSLRQRAAKVFLGGLDEGTSDHRAG